MGSEGTKILNNKDLYTNWIQQQDKNTSYIRAIEILSEIIDENIFELKDIAFLNQLYKDLIKKQRKNDSIYYYEKATSYGKKGFYSASIQSYINFLNYKNNNDNVTIVIGDNLMIDNTSLNQILYGPPGTGKTYNTINRALAIIDGEVPEDRNEAKARYESLSSAGQIEFVTFHQSYGYEEFVEGIKANTIDGKISYDVESGIFKKLSRKAESNYLQSLSKIIKVDFNTIFKEVILDKMSDKLKIEMPRTYFYIIEINERTIFFEKSDGNTAHSLSIKTLQKMYDNGKNEIIKGGLSVYYEPLLKLLLDGSKRYTKQKKDLKNHILIIDEINRGNISKIFGELITLIEASKRIGAEEEIRLRLPYSNDLFGVPSNLYIIGTMNTADRSIALMDTALRRRFEFVEMMPRAELLDFEVEDINLEHFLRKINERVEYLYDRDHTIGHAYFMELHVSSDLNALNTVMKNKIIPLLQEYFYDDWEKILLVLNDGFIEKKQLKAHQIFDVGIDDEYVEEEKFVYAIKENFEKEAYLKLCQNR